MSKLRQSRARDSQSDSQYLRKQHQVRQSGSLPEHRIVKMQRTIGNQAVQRLLAQHDIQADSHAEVQRAPGGERPGALATIVLSKKGKVRGTSRIAGHEGKIELLSISFGTIQKPNTSRETDGEEQRIEVSLSKYVDESSQALLQAMATGETVKSGQFEFIRSDDEGKVDVYHTMDFSDGLISSYTASGSGSGDRAIETFTIEFRVKPKQ